jgi:hypothetical protein
VGTAYLTLFLLAVYYIFDQILKDVTNPIDHATITSLRKPLEFQGSVKWGNALRKGVRMFCDQQFVTGIGLLISPFSQLPCGIVHITGGS